MAAIQSAMPLPDTIQIFSSTLNRVAKILSKTSSFIIFPFRLVAFLAKFHPKSPYAIRLNLVSLDGGTGGGIRLDLTQHLGSHPKYNAAVTKKLDELIRVNPNISDLDAARALQQYVDQLRAGLERSTSKHP